MAEAGDHRTTQLHHTYMVKGGCTHAFRVWGCDTKVAKQSALACTRKDTRAIHWALVSEPRPKQATIAPIHFI